MGNKPQQQQPLTEQIAVFDPLIFPQALAQTEILRKKLGIGRNFKKLPNASEVPEKLTWVLKAAQVGDSKFVLDKLNADKWLINAQNQKLRTVLHHAIQGAHYDLVSALLQLPTISLNTPDLNGRTPLLFACYYGFPDKGSKLYNKTVGDREGSEFHQRMKAIILILSSDPRLDLDMRDWWKRTALMYAANACLFPQISVMVERGANVNLRDIDLKTALHYAALTGDLNIARTLIEHKAQIEIPDRHGWRPLHYAAKCNHLDMVKYLKTRGALVTAATNQNQIPAQLASNLEVTWFLEDRFTCETHPFLIDFCDKLQKIPVFGRARVGMSMCPGRNKKNWRRQLDQDIAKILEAQIQTVVTLVQQEELDSMGIPNMIAEFQKVGLESIHFQIHDKWVPSDMTDLVACVNMLVTEIKQEKTVLVHCNGGKGRTGLIVVAAMMAMGMEQDEGVRIIREARPGMIYNPAQLIYLHAYGKFLAEQRLLLQQAK